MLTLTQATWLQPDGTLARGRIAIADGRLDLRPGDEAAAPGASDRQPAQGDARFDAAGLLALPGWIDGHVHLREPGEEAKEGIRNGTLAALKGGVTSLLDMPNNRPPITTALRLDAKRALFSERSRVNWGLHLQAREGGDLPRPAHVASCKVYLARASTLLPVTTAERLAAILGAYPRVTVHAELQAALRGPRPGKPYGLQHHEHRPRQAIVAALALLERALASLPDGQRPRLILAHVSTVEELAWLRAAARRGWDVWGETCAHYLLFTSADYQRLGQGLKVNPPLRDAADREALREALGDGTLRLLASDHAPHLPRHKRDAHEPPSGLPGLEWLWPLALHLVEQGLLTWPRLARLAAAPAECYGLAGRGALVDGAWADLALVAPPPRLALPGDRSEALAPPGARRAAGGDRPAALATARPAPLPIVTRAGYNPYGELGLGATVAATLINGQFGLREGRFLPTRGQELL